MELRRYWILAAFIVCNVFLTTGCKRDTTYPHRPITLICPWSQGGGTDRCSRQIAVHLEQELGVPVNVVNATGGKGVTGHSRGQKARPDGYTLLMATLELSTMHWSGLTELSYKDYIPLMSINEDYAALFVKADSKWHTLQELEDDIRANPGKLKASGTSTGGAWHLAVAGWLLKSGMQVDDVIWISSTGSAPSISELNSGGIDMVCCALNEAEPFLSNGGLRALGVMSPNKAKGYESVPTFASQGSDWSLGGWRGMMVPLGTPDEVTEKLMAALDKIVTGKTKITQFIDDQQVEQSFPQFMDSQRFDNTFRKSDEFKKFLHETDMKFGDLLTSDAMRSVNEDPYNSMLYPGGLLVLIGVLTIAIFAFSLITDRAGDANAVVEESDPLEQKQLTPRGLILFLLTIGAALFYLFFAEQIGFLLTAIIILGTLLISLGTPIWQSTLLTLVVVPVIFQLFAVLLRVPLPQGFLEW